MFAHIGVKFVDQRSAQVLSNRPTFLRTFAIDRPLDLEQGIDAAHELDCDRR